MTELFRDVRVGLRMLRASPAHTSAAVLTIAMAIGMNAAIASMGDALVFRRLPYHEPERLVRVFGSHRPTLRMDRMPIAPANFGDWQRAAAFEGLAAYRLEALNVVGDSHPERLRVARVSGELFDVLGVAPALGRVIGIGDDRPGAEPVIVLSHRLWVLRFGSDPSIVGGRLHTASGPRTIVGVMPPSFRFPIGWIGRTDIDAWTPLALSSAEMSDRRSMTLSAVARLAPGATVAEAQAAMDAVTAQLEVEHPDTNQGWGVSLMPLDDVGVLNVKPLFASLAVAAALLLLIGCANVANLLLARGLDRTREVTVRLALGAPRWRIARQLLTEGLLLAGVGGVLGVLAAWWGTSILAAMTPPAEMPDLQHVTLNGRVLLTTAALTLSTGVAASLAPAVVSSNTRLATALQASSRTGEGRGAARTRSLLVIGEVVLTIVLLACAMAVWRSFSRYTSIDPGFEPARAVTMRMTLPVSRYPTPASWAAFAERIEQEVSALPDVDRAGIGSGAPMEGTGRVMRYRVLGRPTGPVVGRPPAAEVHGISPMFLDATGMRVLRGRGLTAADGGGGQAVALVNEEFVRRAMAGDDPLRQQLVLQGDINRQVDAADTGPPVTVVGVVADVKEYGPHRMTPPAIYVPFRQAPQSAFSLVVRGGGDALQLVPTVRARVQAIAPEQPVFNIRPLSEVLAESHATLTLSTLLLGLFAILALTLSLLGMFGVMMYGAKRQAREWAIRMALGASPRAVFRLVIRRGLTLMIAGLALGAGAAVPAISLLTRAMKQSMNVDLLGPGGTLWITMVATMLGVAVAATAGPARRAMRSEPVATLRAE